MQFVVQEHHDGARHFDLRLEKDGVYKSWTAHQRLPDRPGIERVVTQAEDCDLIFGSFEGTIPDGQYAGKVQIWDQGDYICHEWGDTEIRVDLKGKKLNGQYALVGAPHLGKRYWVIEKRGPAESKCPMTEGQ
ncbi:MAG: DNA polymerase ligase N-terminal domain-containing protein [Phycisphaerae bacterium]|nr:DNA polymerase ligase N-terminal domain-containing protein [Phycisphaerae bacterium]